MTISSRQIGHLLFELDQLHGEGMTSSSDHRHQSEKLHQIEEQIQRNCSESERARLLKMSRAYRNLSATDRCTT